METQLVTLLSCQFSSLSKIDLLKSRRLIKNYIFQYFQISRQSRNSRLRRINSIQTSVHVRFPHTNIHFNANLVSCGRFNKVNGIFNSLLGSGGRGVVEKNGHFSFRYNTFYFLNLFFVFINSLKYLCMNIENIYNPR